MALTVGSHLGHYDVTALIGEGGMGQVYQATDTKLNRQVALKILPEAFASDPDRLARFQREAQVLASLNHPGIAAIYGIEVQDDTRALVLELVEGPTLADRIARGPIPVDEALPIAKQIAEALEAAHESGVIHRDLKPANIKVREDGTVKVLDFGLAKALDTAPERDPSQSPTLTAAATQMGVIMGTAAYMSPEQARGKLVDKRTDIWAFGVVLHEMLTGQRAFQGEDVSLTLASVMKSELDVKTMPDEVPLTVRTVLSRCLQKDPSQRLRDMGDVRLGLEGVFGSAAAGSDAEPAPAAETWRRPGVLVVVGLLLLVAGALGRDLFGPERTLTEPRVTRFTIRPERSGAVSTFHLLAISPDGSQLVYPSDGGLHVRPLAATESAPLRGTEGALSPFFSPDGRWVGFWQLSGLRKVPVAGGAPVSLAEAPGGLWGAHWDTEDSMLVGMGPAGIVRVPAEGGATETLVSVEAGEVAASPQMLPGDQWVLFTLRPDGSTSLDDSQVAVQLVETGERRTLIPGGRDARYLPTGHLVYALGATLFAVPFNLETLDVSINPVTLVEDLNPLQSGTFSVADDGTLAYGARGEVESDGYTLGWVDSEGRMTPLTQGRGLYRAPRLSPAGDRFAVRMSGADLDLWVYDLERDTMSRLTEEGTNAASAWTPDGRSVTFASDREGPFDLYERPIDGSGEATLLHQTSTIAIPGAWSPDGTRLAYYEATGTGEDRDLWVLTRNGEASPFLATEFNERAPVLSRDGQWIAYVSDQSGEDAVYVQPFPDGGPVSLVSVEGGTEPVWSRDGSQLFFRDRTGMMTVDVEDGPDFAAGRPRVMFTAEYEFDPLGVGTANYDVAEDGRFLMIRREGAAHITVVINWFEELKRLAPID